MSKIAKAVRTLAEEVFSRETGARDAARKRYPILLEAQEPDAAAVAELQEAMRLLGKGPAELEADAATLATYRQLQSTMKLGKGIGERLGAAVTAVGNFQAETRKILEDRQQQLADLIREENALRSRESAADAARQEIDKLRSRHPDLLMHESEVRPADLV
jgi:hypothetical protein